MNPQLAKEFRPLLLPWSIAAVAAAGHFIGGANSLFAKGEFGSFLSGLAGTGFIVGCLVLTALPLGFELHAHTLGLLLSQPADRVRLWKNKLLVATVTVLALGIVHGLASALAGQLRWQETLACLGFMAAAVCSVGYWTLAAGSVLIGIACAVSIPIWIASAVHVAVYYFLGIEVNLSEQTTLLLGGILCLGYCALFLWLGRRQFVCLELKTAVPARIAQIPAALVPGKLTELFRSRPNGATANLIRKEFCLQKPVFLVSAIFTACWLAMLLLLVLRPAWHDNLVGVLHGLTGTQIVLMAVLAGCVSLGDDKALGTAAWHLTLPVSSRRQWFIKLCVAAATGFTMSFVLPGFLAALTLVKARVGLLAVNSVHDIEGFAAASTLGFVVSFWSASMVTNTVRAALTCMIALIGLIGCIFLGFAVPQSFFAPSGHYLGLQSDLAMRVLAHFQLPPKFLLSHDGVLGYGIAAISLTFVATALVQSLRQFRRLQTKFAVRVKYAGVLAAIVLVGSFWFADLLKSLESSAWRLEKNFQKAVTALWQDKDGFPPSAAVTVTAAELERTGALSEIGKVWLKDSRVTFTPAPTTNPRKITLQVQLVFPNGRQYSYETVHGRPGESKP